jgi:hypothetical protein
VDTVERVVKKMETPEPVQADLPFPDPANGGLDMVGGTD